MKRGDANVKVRNILLSIVLGLFLIGNAWGLEIPMRTARISPMMVGGGVPAEGGATDYTDSCHSWWMMEDAASPSLDGSANNNDLTWAYGPAQNGNSIEGSYSLAFDKENYEEAACTTANLDANFPGKNYTGDLTLGAWVYLDSVNEDMVIVAKAVDVDILEGCWSLRYDAGSTRFEFAVLENEASTVVAYHSTTPSASTWYHVVGTVTTGSNNVKIYVGTTGASSTAGTSASITASYPNYDVRFTVGTLGAGYAPWDGLIDEVFIAKSVFSAAVIEEIRAHGLAGER